MSLIKIVIAVVAVALFIWAVAAIGVPTPWNWLADLLAVIIGFWYVLGAPNLVV